MNIAKLFLQFIYCRRFPNKIKNVALSIKKMGVINPRTSAPAIAGKAKKRIFPIRNSQIPDLFIKYINTTPAMIGTCSAIMIRYHLCSNALVKES
jgi:hypothetical protein